MYSYETSGYRNVKDGTLFYISLLPFIFPMVFNAFLFGIDEVIKLPYIKASLERWVIVHFATELSRLFNLKKALLFCSARIISFVEISGYKIEKLFINITEGFLSCFLLES